MNDFFANFVFYFDLSLTLDNYFLQADFDFNEHFCFLM